MSSWATHWGPGRSTSPRPGHTLSCTFIPSSKLCLGCVVPLLFLFCFPGISNAPSFWAHASMGTGIFCLITRGPISFCFSGRCPRPAPGVRQVLACGPPVLAEPPYSPGLDPLYLAGSLILVEDPCPRTLPHTQWALSRHVVRAERQPGRLEALLPLQQP